MDKKIWNFQWHTRFKFKVTEWLYYSDAQKKKIEQLTSNIFTPIKTQTIKKGGKFVDVSKFITPNDETKKLARNNSYVGKKQYDLSNFQTKENIFPGKKWPSIF